MTSDLIQLSSRVVIRKEHFGGVLFNKDTGDFMEVDREAYIVISIIKDVGIVDMKSLLELPISYKGRKIDIKRIKDVLSKFNKIGITKTMPNGVLSENASKMLVEKSRTMLKWPAGIHLSAPETAHWAVTFKCDAVCPDCYIERHKSLFEKELDTHDSLNLIDKIVSAGIFQLAIGGGEPFIRNDLETIVRFASEKGLIVHITTGKYEIDMNRLDALAKYIKTIQLGIRTDTLLHKESGSVDKLKTLMAQLNERSIIAGANLIMTRSAIQNLDRLISMLSEIGFKRFTLLRYKPPADVKRWLLEKPDKDDLELLERKLPMIQDKHTGIHIRIDCALAFLERRLDHQIAMYSGIRGCVAGERIISIAPDGSVFPCSQLVGDIFKAGNLLNEDFETIWNKSKVIKKYRNFRDNNSFNCESCGKCSAKSFCGGCRVFADDAFGFDPGCPEHFYGSGFTGDEYDIIDEIQDMIGCTDVGFPYATREQIEKWLEEDNDRGYPAWIRHRQL